MATDSSFEKDHVYAFSCAANLLLFEADPGLRVTSVGGPGEQRTITRSEHLVSIYARLLLLELRADPDRLAAVATEARRSAQRAADDHAAEEFAEAETVAAELAETAIEMIREAGADRDPRARERLLTTTDYQTSKDVFGSFLGDPSLAGPPDSMLEKLAQLDRKDQAFD